MDLSINQNISTPVQRCKCLAQVQLKEFPVDLHLGTLSTLTLLENKLQFKGKSGKIWRDEDLQKLNSRYVFDQKKTLI